MQTKGINHLALVCRDMAETVDFYTRVLGMPLVKTVQLPDGGQHFFFDCGGGSLLAFFWWENAPAAAPGIASVEDFPTKGMSAVGSMNHVAFEMDEADLEKSIDQLKAAGVHVSVPVVVNHDDSPAGVVARPAPRRLRALGLLHRPERHHAGVRLPDPRSSASPRTSR